MMGWELPRWTTLLVVGVCGAMLTTTLVGQETKPASAGVLPMFDVVSVKPNKTDSAHVSVHYDDGNFSASNVSLKNLILTAYGLKVSQLIGLPKWAESERFDVLAKVVDPNPAVMKNLTGEQRRMMLQPMLVDRFQLKFHHEMKTLPVFEMVVGKGGPKFTQVTAEEKANNKGVNGVRPGGVSVHNTQLMATGVPLSTLADELSAQLHRMVIDKTGLAGEYNLSLAWAPDDAPPSTEAAPPTLFTALQEQLGLKLEPGKAEVDTLVVESAGQPTEN